MVIEPSHSIFLNLSFTGKGERVFHLQLNGQAVGIPPCLSGHMITLHRLVPANDVLIQTRQHMMDSRATISCGWAFIKGIMWPPFSYLDALVENFLLFPEAEDILFQLKKVNLGVYFPEHG
jgi:hypothetical protein